MPSTNKVGARPHTVYIQSVGFFSGCLLFKIKDIYKKKCIMCTNPNCEDVVVI